MKPIFLDELPQYSPWPARLLGVAEWTPTVRTAETVYREYETEKYAPLLEAVEGDPTLSLAEVRGLALEEPGRLVAMSVGLSLFVTALDRAVARTEDALLRYVKYYGHRGRTLVDLGCGYGHLLASIRRSPLGSEIALRGGEASPSAVALVRHFGFDADGFSFLADGTCEPLEAAEPPIVVVTSYALHQLASAEVGVRLLERYREKIGVIINLEPENKDFGGGLLGLLRLRYGQVNGYSADLNEVLERRDDVTVESRIANLVGQNCLLPGTLTVWNFR